MGLRVPTCINAFPAACCSRNVPPRMNLSPGNAAFLSLLIPGSAHLLQQRPVRAGLALLSTVGLFFLGYSILGQRLWHFVWFPPFDFLKPVFDVVPLNLWPEWFNLGSSAIANLLQESHSDTTLQSNLLRLRRVPVPGEHWALFATSASGVLSFLWAADAHHLSSQKEQAAAGKPVDVRANPALMAFYSWLLPGSGHWQAGQRDKGVVMGGAILLLFVMAMFFSSGHAIDRVDSPAYWIGQVLFGGGALFASLVTAPMQLPETLPGVDVGATLALVAGVMNMVVMVDAYTVAERGGAGAGSGSPVPASSEAAT